MTNTDSHLNLPERIHEKPIAEFKPDVIMERLRDIVLREKNVYIKPLKVDWIPPNDGLDTNWQIQRETSDIEHELSANVELYRKGEQDFDKYRNHVKNKPKESAKLRILDLLKGLRRLRIRNLK